MLYVLTEYIRSTKRLIGHQKAIRKSSVFCGDTSDWIELFDYFRSFFVPKIYAMVAPVEHDSVPPPVEHDYVWWL